MDDAVVALYRATRLAQRISKDDPLDVAQSRVLAAVRRLGPARPSAIAADNHADLSTVSRQIDGLARKGLVRKASDPQDARATLVEVTAEGQGVLSTLVANRTQAIAPAISHWSARDRQRFIALVTRFADDLDAYLTKDDA